MDKTHGIITYYFKGMEGRRPVDKLTELVEKSFRKCFSSDGYWKISNKNNEVIGKFISIYGPKPLVKFLEWSTEERSKGARPVILED